LFHLRIKLTAEISPDLTDDYTDFAEPENKLTFTTFRNGGKTWMLQKTNAASSLHLLEENTATLHSCLLFPYNLPSKTFIKKIDQMITSGLVARILKKEYAVYRDTKHDDTQEAQPLNMDHLGICFIAIMICLGICCAVFMIECLARYLAG
jgi:hypothetical protein